MNKQWAELAGLLYHNKIYTTVYYTTLHRCFTVYNMLISFTLNIFLDFSLIFVELLTVFIVEGKERISLYREGTYDNNRF